MTKRRRSTGQTIGSILVGFDQQVFRATKPPAELVESAKALPPIAGRDGSMLSIVVPDAGREHAGREHAGREPEGREPEGREDRDREDGGRKDEPPPPATAIRSVDDSERSRPPSMAEAETIE